MRSGKPRRNLRRKIIKLHLTHASTRTEPHSCDLCLGKQDPGKTLRLGPPLNASTRPRSGTLGEQWGGRMFSVEEVLELAIRLEKNGESYYRHFRSSREDPEIRKTLAWLADQEVQHAEFFSRLKQKHLEHRTDYHETPEGALLQDYLGQHALSLDEVDLSHLTDTQQVLQVALEFEKDTILFYDMIRGFVTDQRALAQLEAIIQEELRHIEILQTLITQGPVTGIPP
jgi:rubrerythrin